MSEHFWPDLGDVVEQHRRRINAVGFEKNVRIVAVTKGFGPEAVLAAQRIGLDVGENYAQEAKAKQQAVAATTSTQLRWHFIGQLQTNKVRQLAPFIDMWQSVDSASLVQEIAKRAPGAEVMVQVNLSEEDGRGGCSWSDAPKLVEAARNSALDVVGVMGVGLHGPAEESRLAFRRLASFARTMEVSEVSMGMSGDYEVAVQEGATIVRLGSALFGPRPLR